MDGKGRRKKGADAEREVAAIFREHGFAAERWRSGLDIKGDVRGIDGLHIEVKRQERLALPEWIRQAQRESNEKDIPVVIFRQSRSQWHVSLSLGDFLHLLKEANLWDQAQDQAERESDAAIS